jgi:hypothetical protein
MAITTGKAPQENQRATNVTWHSHNRLPSNLTQKTIAIAYSAGYFRFFKPTIEYLRIRIFHRSLGFSAE